MRTITAPTDPAHGVDLEIPANLTPQRPPPDPRPSLCEAGPCRHYHRFALQVDAEPPKVRRLPVVVPGVAGDTYQPPATFHTETHRYCYPDTGIEMPLGVMPVTECNRWEPMAPDEGRRKRERAYWQSKDGGDHMFRERSWQNRQDKASRDAEEAERLILDAQVEAELAHYSFGAEEIFLDSARWYRGHCGTAPFLGWERIEATAHGASDSVRAAVRDYIRELIINNEPLPQHLKETDEHRTVEE